MVTTTIPVAGVVKVLVAMAIIAQSVCRRPFALSNTGVWPFSERPHRLAVPLRRVGPHTRGRPRVVSVNGSDPLRNRELHQVAIFLTGIGLAALILVSAAIAGTITATATVTGAIVVI